MTSVYKLENYGDVLTVQELSTVLRVCKKTTYTLLHTGRINYVTVGRKIIIPKQSVMDFLKTTV